MSTAELRLKLDEPAVAQAALAPDDDGFLTSRIDGDVLVLAATSDSPMGLLRTLDDALACLRAMGT